MANVNARNPLLPSKQAEVAQRVRASNLPIADFEFMEIVDSNQEVTMLTYKPNALCRVQLVFVALTLSMRYR